MALNFKNLKDPKLGLTDKLQFGKFKDCRLCDIIEDHYEYLIWVEKQGFVKFQQEVTDLILEQGNFEKWQPPLEIETTDTYLRKQLGHYSNYARDYVFSDMEDDIPF